MKKFTLFVVVISFLSCSENTEEVIHTKETTTLIVKETKDSSAIESASSIEAVQEDPISIEDFPSTWFMLSPKDGNNEELVIYKYCEAETQQIWIRNEVENWYLYVLYGQDSQRYKIIDFDAYEEERELYQVMYGSFLLETPDNPDAEPEVHDYLWNKDLMFCSFDGFFNGEAMLVSEQNKENYEAIKEDCDYLDEQ